MFIFIIYVFILLPEKFLQFDWLRADTFQLNLKYLHVKVTVTMVIVLPEKFLQFDWLRTDVFQLKVIP